MIIDKNGKLFGKISIIDIVIVALLVVAVCFLGLRFLNRNSPGLSGSSLDKLEITFYSEEVNDFVADAISIGDSTMEMAQYASFGTVTDKIVGPSITWVPDAAGVVHGAPKDKYYSLTVKMTAYGTIGSTGFTVDGTTYFVGRTVVLYVGKAGFQGRIASVEKVEG